MLSGVYLILGYYTVGFFQAEKTSSVTVEAVANTVQAEQLARTGISLALVKMGDDVSVKAFDSLTTSMNSGTITYQATMLTATTSRITSRAVFNDRQIIVTAVFTHGGDRWRITRTFASPTPEKVS
jgi:hypothetical protein